MAHTTNLDDRLFRAAALFPACAYGADIGADHGRLSCFLLETGKCQRMCVADISAPSLAKARALIAERGLGARADFCVGDGLSVLPRPAQAIAILGMGGRTVSHILLDGKDRLRGAALVLSAHTEMMEVRKALAELGYRIEKEEISRAAGRFYVLLYAAPGLEALTEKQEMLGPRLMETNPEHYRDYLAWRIQLAAVKRSEEGKKELLWLKEEYSRVCNGSND